jgi:hypothetical protein
VRGDRGGGGDSGSTISWMEEAGKRGRRPGHRAAVEGLGKAQWVMVRSGPPRNLHPMLQTRECS